MEKIKKLLISSLEEDIILGLNLLYKKYGELWILDNLNVRNSHIWKTKNRNNEVSLYKIGNIYIYRGCMYYESTKNILYGYKHIPIKEI